jgi:hypothetical protein
MLLILKLILIILILLYILIIPCLCRTAADELNELAYGTGRILLGAYMGNSVIITQGIIENGNLNSVMTPFMGEKVLTLGKLLINFPDSLTTIGNYAFNNCKTLTQLPKFPPNLTTIGNYAFYSCKIQNLTFTYKIETIDEKAFYNCPIINIYCNTQELIEYYKKLPAFKSFLYKFRLRTV